MNIAALLTQRHEALTLEQKAEYERRMEELCREYEKEMIKRIYRCPDCGVDTLNYSHLLGCMWRGR